MKLSEVSEKTGIVKRIITQLKRSSKQNVALVEAQKVKRVGGASTKPIHIAMEGNQIIKMYIRIEDSEPDIFRIDINGKNFPIAGDFSLVHIPTFNKSVGLVGEAIRKGQKKFEEQLAKKSKKSKSPVTKRTPKNKVQQIAVIKEEIAEIDTRIEKKEAEKAELENQLKAS